MRASRAGRSGYPAAGARRPVSRGRARTSMGIVRARRQPLHESEGAMTGTESVAVTAGADTTNDRELTDAVAANVARLRRNSGMDVERLATLSGLATEQIIALEAGRVAPHLRMLWALADAFE